MEVLRLLLGAILPEAAVAVVLIHRYRVILLPAAILRAVAAVRVAIPAVVAVAVLLVRPVVAVVLQEEDRYIVIIEND